MSKQGGNEVQESSADLALAEVTKAKVADFNKRWAPIQRANALSIDQSGRVNSTARKGATGMATADTDAAFAQARQQSGAATTASGQTGQASNKLGIATMGNDQATSVGLTTSQADLNVDANRIAGLNNVVALGQGKQATAVRGMVDQAQSARAVAADDARASLERDMGNAQLVGNAAGLAFGKSQKKPVGGGVDGVYYEGSQPVYTNSYGR